MIIISNNNEEGDFVSEVFRIQAPNSKTLTNLFCRWRISNSSNDEDASQYFHSLDLLLSVLPKSTNGDCTEEFLNISDATGTALEALARHTCFTIQGLVEGTEIATKVLLAPGDGYLCRTDILDVRMRHSEFVDAVISFSSRERHLRAIPAQAKASLLPLLLSSPGALVAKQSHLSKYETLKLLQKDLKMRLSFDWVLPTKVAARRVAVIGGRPMYDATRGMYGSQGFFEAAKALDISMIVFDKPGHWLEGEKYAHLRDDFIAIDMSKLEDLPQRIAEALRGRHIDGILTFTDEHVITTAKAAEILGLPTEPAQDMLRAHHKHEMRKLVNNTNVQSVRLDSLYELESPAFAEELKSLKYPLIVKPCRGESSRGVRKVTDQDNMREAVCMLDKEGLAEHGILLETYVDGPEVDANFVLWDGEVLFLEVTDNFPCQGDARGAILADNFSETLQISNSRLPADEIEIICSSLHRSLLQLGFRSGVFHVEARMQNSSMGYQDVNGDGILDLVVSKTGDGATTNLGFQQDTFLIEVNARPPGTGGTWSTLYTYGVDFGALQLLRAIEDRERFEALSKPFSFPSSGAGDGGGAQYWTAHCMIPIHRENILVPDDFFNMVYRAAPEIVPHIVRAELSVQPGSVVSPSGQVPWIAYLLLCSRTSRRHALEMHKRVSTASKKVLDVVSGYGL
ncbi:hypothetical protein N7463_008609 [Penicillium fimorum]|uniref:ATP-grasp domain-containing protein n=1 Tax=Penicillium fimorum TaxID=1882269 RepID=A0A9W9XP77_9EURO|nr:hypothetical protein N7463_008609 [Penicillium fimorum]